MKKDLMNITLMDTIKVIMEEENLSLSELMTKYNGLSSTKTKYYITKPWSSTRT